MVPELDSPYDAGPGPAAHRSVPLIRALLLAAQEEVCGHCQTVLPLPAGPLCPHCDADLIPF